MTSYPLAALLGISLGALHGLILWAAMQELSLASFILYGNRYLVPIATANIVSAVALFTVLSSTWWLPWMMNLVDKYAVKRDEE
jgi:hypothetical protein